MFKKPLEIVALAMIFGGAVTFFGGFILAEITGIGTPDEYMKFAAMAFFNGLAAAYAAHGMRGHSTFHLRIMRRRTQIIRWIAGALCVGGMDTLFAHVLFDVNISPVIGVVALIVGLMMLLVFGKDDDEIIG